MRSNARGRNDADLRDRNLQLIESARQAMGPGVSNGIDAEVEREEDADVSVGLDQDVAAQRVAGIAAGGEAVPAEDSSQGGWPVVGEGRLQAASYGFQQGDDELRIPRAYIPKPGQCRIWFSERPASQQPAPGRCKKLQRRVPPGAYLVRG